MKERQDEELHDLNRHPSKLFRDPHFEILWNRDVDWNEKNKEIEKE